MCQPHTPPKAFYPSPAPREPVEENYLPFDPSAFWLYPDWDSGPVTEPFWMRPLKVPEAPVTLPPGVYMMDSVSGSVFHNCRIESFNK